MLLQSLLFHVISARKSLKIPKGAFIADAADSFETEHVHQLNSADYMLFYVTNSENPFGLLFIMIAHCELLSIVVETIYKVVLQLFIIFFSVFFRFSNF